MLCVVVPCTFMVPDAEEAAYCVVAPPDIGVETVQVALPAGIPVKAMVDDVEPFAVPWKVTVHDVPFGRPVSVKVTV